MIIHGGYARLLRDQSSDYPNDIDILITADGLTDFLDNLSDEQYVVHKGPTGTLNREVVVLLPLDKKLPKIKFDIELISEELYQAAWELEDTSKSSFLGIQIGVVSEATDMIIKQECLPFSRDKHRVDVEYYRNKLGDMDLSPYRTFKALWARQMSDKYLP